MKMSFQWFFDLRTEPDQMQIITVSAGGEMVRERLAPFFQAYKYYKLGRVKLSMVPASTLPVDPLGLSYEELDYPTIDPRDQLTPGLTRITNGEDILEDLTGLDADEQRKLFYTMMLDARWYKFYLQKGLKRSAVPLYWQIGQYHQDVYPGSTMNLPMIDENGKVVFTDSERFFHDGYDFMHEGRRGYSSPLGIFQTGHRGRIGWLPTDALIKYGYPDGEQEKEGNILPANNPIACIELFKLITPPAIKTSYYWRVFVTETVYFKDPVVNNLAFDVDIATKYSYASLDRFIRTSMPRPMLPTEPDAEGTTAYPPAPPNDGSKWYDQAPGPGPDPPGPDPPVPSHDQFPANPVDHQIFIPNWLKELTLSDFTKGVIPSDVNSGVMPLGWIALFSQSKPIGYIWFDALDAEQPENAMSTQSTDGFSRFDAWSDVVKQSYYYTTTTAVHDAIGTTYGFSDYNDSGHVSFEGEPIESD